MKFEELNEGDSFKSERYENLVFKKVRQVNGTCCTPAHSAVGVGHNAKILFATADEIEKIEPIQE